MLNSKILLALLLAWIFLLGCSDKQSSDEGQSELKESAKANFLNVKYMMSLTDTSWEKMQLNQLENNKYVLTFSLITPYESRDCIFEGEGKQKGDEFYFFSKSNNVKILFKHADDGIEVSIDEEKIENICGKDHHIKGIFAISQ
ncbi:hypothetical protein BKH42_04475 [Helicobacter sp. 13S00482-2]|uniref:hypothetical protein n=1 Tax=Helicobacter sp. 13S00482-2 TaxID=1476200 RepID=UPI000BA6D248|nr:hypothetical protein [Helicobacter sp. 13S00482-2]PAF53756.1 hypothetical protein BKH42_04475 [Helicobacter sp. 13S00482-2]